MESRADLVLAVVGLLLVKHFLFDFVLQTRFQRANKSVYGHPGGLLHAGLHVLGTTSVFLIVMPPAGPAAIILGAEFLAHYHIDWIKEQVLRRAHWGPADSRFWAILGGDQLLHGLGYLAIAWALAISA